MQYLSNTIIFYCLLRQQTRHTRHKGKEMNRFSKTKLIAVLLIALSLVSCTENMGTIGKANAKHASKDDNFPKGYFLIPNNLPFALGLVLKHPKSNTLNLSKEQKTKLMAIMKETKPKVMVAAKNVKALELKLRAQLDKKDTQASDLYTQVDNIAKLKSDMTKMHLRCIVAVKNILTEEQHAKVHAYTSVK